MMARIPKKKFSKSSHYLKTVLPLVPEDTSSLEDNKGIFILMELKARAGATGANVLTYKNISRPLKKGVQRSGLWCSRTLMRFGSRTQLMELLIKLQLLDPY